MRICGVKKINSGCPEMVHDSEVSDGYLKVSHGSLPDIDSDYAADKRPDMKAYIEKRYNKDGMLRVFSAGTFTTEKIRSVIKDVTRVHRLPVSTVNYLTKIIDDDLSWTDVMRLAAQDERIRKFIESNPEVFEEIRPIMLQPRAQGIHASALIIVPETIKGKNVECFDLLPIRKMDDLLVSEISGYDIDAIGILKCDILGIKELTRLSDTLNLIEQNYGARYTILQIASQYLNDPKVFEMLREGNTQGVFQLSNDGMTKYIKRMKPDNINDLIASVALFRPGPLDSGTAENYVQAKRGEYEPTYLWGTHDILKETFGGMVYQEQLSMVAQKVGSLTLGDGVNLVKALSKKKLEKVRKFKDKFFDGARKNGCPKEAADKIWSDIEDAAKYSFNKSHATAYGLTAYIGAWLKVHYPTPFYTVVLRDQDEEKLPVLLNEIRSTGGTEIVKPNVNISGFNFVADYKENRIYWSLGRIKQLGPNALRYIEKERELFGEFYDLDDFISRIFRGKFGTFDDDDERKGSRCGVNTRHVKHMILAGAFDEIERVGSVMERYGLLQKAAERLGFKIDEKEFPPDMIDKHYFWARKQMEVSGFGQIDYKRIFDNADIEGLKKNKFVELRDLDNMFISYNKGVVCATVISVTEGAFKDSRTGERKKYGKLQLQQNIDTCSLTLWSEAWAEQKSLLKNSVGRFLISSVVIKWSDYEDRNALQINKGVTITLV